MARARSKYYTNKKIRERIDKILERNATNCANLGTGTPLDLKTREAVEKAWCKMAETILKLDSDFYISVMKNTDGNFLIQYRASEL
jgi:hypothetical protein